MGKTTSNYEATSLYEAVMAASYLKKPAVDGGLGRHSERGHAGSLRSADQDSTEDPEKLSVRLRPFPFNPRNWSLKMRLLAVTSLLLVLGAIATAIAVPLSQKSGASSATASGTASDTGDNGAIARPLFINPPNTSLIDNNPSLSIMPLGASITYGWQSTDGNGYREDLLGLLVRGGNTNVTYVGSRHNGTMANNAVEGWSGYRLDQIWPKANESVPREQPNIVLLNVGTNDCAADWNLKATTEMSTAYSMFTANATDDIGSRMRLLVNYLFIWAPNTTVIMSTLLINKDAAISKRVDYANGRFGEVAKALQAEGKHVLLANMSAAAGGPNATTMADPTHPNDVGYALMANRWYQAVAEAGARGWV